MVDDGTIFILQFYIDCFLFFFFCESVGACVTFTILNVVVNNWC